MNKVLRCLAYSDQAWNLFCFLCRREAKIQEAREPRMAVEGASGAPRNREQERRERTVAGQRGQEGGHKGTKQ